MEQLVRKLREELWYKTKHVYAHERVWESDEEEENREYWNKEGKKKWDLETEEMILDVKQSECEYDL